VVSGIDRRILHGTLIVQAVLLISCGCMFSTGDLRSTGVTRRPHYYVPLRLPTGPDGGYGFPSPVEPSGHPPHRSPRRVSQVPELICRRLLSPFTPESPAAANTRCFTAGGRLHPIRKSGHPHWCNEAESGSLALRLTSSPHGASADGSPRQPPPDRLHEERVIVMVSSFQLTRSTRLSLAHRTSRRVHGMGRFF
jgi:hypothetical protein